MALQFRRGLDSQRTTITPSAGEPIWTTDTTKLYIGDGVTPGGVEISLISTTATASTLGGVKIGTGIAITADGTISVVEGEGITDQDLYTTSSVTFAALTVTNTATISAILVKDSTTSTTLEIDLSPLQQTAEVNSSGDLWLTARGEDVGSNGEITLYAPSGVQIGDGYAFSNGTLKVDRISPVNTGSIAFTIGTTHSGDIQPQNDGSVNIGSETVRLNNLHATRMYTYNSTSTSLTVANGINNSTGFGPTINFGRGINAARNLPANNNTAYRVIANGWIGDTHSLAYSKTIRVAGAWNTTTSVNYGLSLSETLSIPNLREINDITLLPAFDIKAINWGTTPTSTWPPVMQDIEGINIDDSTFASYSRGNNTATTLTSVGTQKQLINTQLYLYGSPSQDSTSTTAGYNTINIIGARLSGAAGSRRNVISGDTIGAVNFRGIKDGDSASGTGSAGATIYVKANNDWLSTTTYSSIVFETVEKDSTTQSQRLSLDSDLIEVKANQFGGKDVSNNDLFVFRSTGGGNYIWNDTTFDQEVIIGGFSGAKIQVFNTTGITTTATTSIGSFDTTGASQTAGKFLVSVVDSGEIHFAEISVISDGTDLWKVEYGTNTSNGALGTFSVAMNGAFATLYFTATAPTSMNIKTSVTVL